MLLSVFCWTTLNLHTPTMPCYNFGDIKWRRRRLHYPRNLFQLPNLSSSNAIQLSANIVLFIEHNIVNIIPVLICESS